MIDWKLPFNIWTENELDLYTSVVNVHKTVYFVELSKKPWYVCIIFFLLHWNIFMRI